MFLKSFGANTSRVVAPLSSSLVRFGLISKCLLSTCGSWTHLPWITVLLSDISSHSGRSTSNCIGNCEAQPSGCKIHSAHNGIQSCVVRFPLAFLFINFFLKKCYIAFWFTFMSFCFSSPGWFTLFGSALRTSHIVWRAPRCFPHHLAGATQCESPCCSSPLPLRAASWPGSWRIGCRQCFWIYGLLWLVIEDEKEKKFSSTKTLDSKCSKSKVLVDFLAHIK